MLIAIWQVMLALAPWLLLGAVLSGVLHVALPNDFVRRHLRGRGGVLKAVALGVPLPLCSCGVIPADLGLKKDGASDGAAVGFLISTPQTGVDSLLVSASFLGWPFAIFKLLSATVTGLVGGWLTDRGTGEAAAHAAPDHNAPPRNRSLWGAVEHSVEVLRTIWGWLVFGVVASAAITVFVPNDLLAGVARHGTLLALLLALVVSLPLYVCATASVPIAAALVGAGLPTGAALVFLMAGPATNVATLGAVYRALGRRALGYYLGTIVVGSLALGYAFDFVLPQTAVAHLHEHGAASIPSVFAAIALTLLMAYFAYEDLRDLLRARGSTRGAAVPGASAPDASAVEFAVEGMTCNGCVKKLTRALSETPGVTSALVTLEPGSLRVEGTIAAEAIRGVVRNAGFTPA